MSAPPDRMAGAAKARAEKVLSSLVRTPNGVMTWREFIDTATSLDLQVSDAMIDWNRLTFNRMTHREQADYEARLRAKTYYWVNNVKVPKIVFDYAKERQS